MRGKTEPAIVSIRTATGVLFERVLIQGNGGAIANHACPARIESMIQLASEGSAHGAYEPRPGYVRAFRRTAREDTEAGLIDLFDAKLVSWEPIARDWFCLHCEAKGAEDPAEPIADCLMHPAIARYCWKGSTPHDLVFIHALGSGVYLAERCATPEHEIESVRIEGAGSPAHAFKLYRERREVTK